MKDGFEPNRFHEDSLEMVDGSYILRVQRREASSCTVALFADYLLSAGVEGLIVFSFIILEILFIYAFGLMKTMPFIALSVFNLVLVLLHRLRTVSEREI